LKNAASESIGQRSGTAVVTPARASAGSVTTKIRRLGHDERRAALLRAAKELSVEQSVTIPSLDAIIKRAGGSRRSIYTEFGGKEGLRNALVDEISAEILAALSEDFIQGKDLRATLVRFARNFVSVLMSEWGIGLSRVVMRENFASPERAQSFFAQGPGKGAKMLARVLEAARTRGEIDVRDCLLAANCFIGMVRGNLYLERVLLLRPPLGGEEIDSHVDVVVDIFLGGVRRR
jgi:AcrR family transcriptional regulator